MYPLPFLLCALCNTAAGGMEACKYCFLELRVNLFRPRTTIPTGGKGLVEEDAKKNSPCAFFLTSARMTREKKEKKKKI